MYFWKAQETRGKSGELGFGLRKYEGMRVVWFRDQEGRGKNAHEGHGVKWH